MPRSDMPELDALHDLLERERAAVLAADLPRLARLVDEKERLLKRIAARPPEPDTVTQIAELARHNQGLLDAALRGMREGLGRLADIRRGGAEVRTYGADGQSRTLPGTVRRLERRA